MTGRTIVLAGLTLFLGAAPAAAQRATLPPGHLELPGCAKSLDAAPADFLLCGHLDVVTGHEGPESITANGDAYVGAWAFECRSGLQPQSQRPGSVEVYWWRPNAAGYYDAEEFEVPYIVTVPRPDVAAGYAQHCPAVGSLVGFNAALRTPSNPGTWNLDLVVYTTDGAGRTIEWRGRKMNVVVLTAASSRSR